MNLLSTKPHLPLATFCHASGSSRTPKECMMLLLSLWFLLSIIMTRQFQSLLSARSADKQNRKWPSPSRGLTHWELDTHLDLRAELQWCGHWLNLSLKRRHTHMNCRRSKLQCHHNTEIEDIKPAESASSHCGITLISSDVSSAMSRVSDHTDLLLFAAWTKLDLEDNED